MQAQFQQQLTDYKPGPYEQAMNDEGLAWMKATSGETPLDISKLPGMAPYLSLYNAASAKQQGQRLGTGLMPYGSAMANPALIANLAQQEESQRRQIAGGQLSDAFRIRDAEVRGSALPLIGVTENRAANKLGTVAQMSNSAGNRWAQHQIRPGFWANLALEASRGTGAAAITAAKAGAL